MWWRDSCGAWLNDESRAGFVLDLYKAIQEVYEKELDRQMALIHKP